jgi:hypothetical protein
MRGALSICLGLLLVTGVLGAECAPSLSIPGGFPLQTESESIGLSFSAESGATADPGAVQAAGAMWSTCGNGVPSVSMQQAQISVHVAFKTGQPSGACGAGGGCGCVSLSRDSAGQVTSATISVHERSSGSNLDCGNHYDHLIAHELGHVMGLGNADIPACGLCVGRVMIPSLRSGTVQTTDCEKADEKWLTEREQQHHGDEGHPCQSPPA